MAILLAMLGAVLAGVAAFGSFRRINGWGQPEFWLAPAVAVWPFIVLVVASVVPPFHEFISDENRDFAVTVAPLMLVVLWIGVTGVRSRKLVIGLAAGAVGLMAVGTAIAALLTGQSWLHGLIAAAVLAGCGLVRRGGPSALSDGVLVAVVAMLGLVGLYAAVLPQLALRVDCIGNASKCELLGGYISIGGGGSSNAFAITLAMLGGFVVFRLRFSIAIAMTIAVGSAALASGARLATACAVAGCVVALIAKAPRIGHITTVASVAVAAAASLVPAVVRFPAHFLTERGTLWARARGFVFESPLFGHGLSFWVRDAQTQAYPPRSYSPHNLWLDLGVAVGVVGAAAVAIAVVCGLVLSTAEARLPALLLVVGVLIVGCFESTFMPFRINPVPTGMIVLLAYLSASQRFRWPKHGDEPTLTGRAASRPAPESA